MVALQNSKCACSPALAAKTSDFFGYPVSNREIFPTIIEAAMSKTLSAILAASMLNAGCGAMHGRGDMHARHHGERHGQMMARMDVNGDGMISRDEFLRAQEAMFDRMKGPNGMISLRDMPHGSQGPGPR